MAAPAPDQLARSLSLEVTRGEARTLWGARVVSIFGLTALLSLVASPVYILLFGAVRLALYGVMHLIATQDGADDPRRHARTVRAVAGVRLLMGVHLCWVALDLAFEQRLLYVGSLLLLGYLVVTAHQAQPDRRAYAVVLAPPLVSLAALAALDRAITWPQAAAVALFLFALFSTAIRRSLTNGRLERAKAEAIDAQAALKAGIAQALVAEEVALMGSWRIHLPERRRTWSPGAFRVFGLPVAPEPPSLDEAIGFFRPGDRERIGKLIEDSLRGRCGFDVEHVILRADGEPRTVRVRGHFTEEEGEAGTLYGVVQDVTTERRAYDALGASEAKYRLVTEHATDMIATMTPDSRVEFVSPACVHILGYAPHELVGRKTLSLTHPDDLPHVVAYFERILAAGPQGGAAGAYEFRARRSDGAYVWLEGQPRVDFSESGEPLRYQDVVRDITARKAVEAELLDARLAAEAAARAKSDFLANMSHELRTPLTSIIGYASLMSDQHELGTVTRDYVRRVQNASGALLATVNDVLDFSKLEAGQVEIRNAPTDLLEVCRHALELFAPQAESKNLRLELVVGRAPPPLVAIDAGRLSQMLLNLIGNAVKFTERGSVTVHVDHHRHRLAVEVRDTGPGIAEEPRRALFKRFSQVDGSSTRTHGGTGLGLAISRALAERMGGSISVESTLGEGSRFSLDLPAATVQPSAPLRAPPSAAARLDEVRVLVVDDTPVTRELARILLEGAGAEVFEAGSGEEALKIAGVQPVDAILLDIRMPDMNGHQVLSRLRSIVGPNDAVPVIAFTADAFTDDVAAYSRFDGLVNKPIDPVRLVAATRTAVDGETAWAELAHAG